MSFEFFDNESSYVSKQEVAPDVEIRIKKQLGHLATILS